MIHPALHKNLSNHNPKMSHFEVRNNNKSPGNGITESVNLHQKGSVFWF